MTSRLSSRAAHPFLLSLAVLASPAAAQDAPTRAISGRVEDASGSAVSGASVSVSCGERRRTVTSGRSGAFMVRDLPPARCAVEAISQMFDAARLEVDLTTDHVAFARLVLPIPGVESEITVTPTRGEQERTFDVPEAVSIATKEEIATRPHQLLPQVLREETGVLVQQTTTAQASPFIRGFSAQRILYLLDGIRFNTATYRAGATQYLGWVDPSLAQRIEVVRGPSSVQYGSDALGGTINVIAQRPGFSQTPLVDGFIEGMAGSADRSGGVSGDLSVRTARIALRGGAATRRVDDLRAGRGRDSHSALTRFLGLPSEDFYSRLPETSFRQGGLHVAATVPAGATGVVEGLYMHEAQAGVSRYDRILGGDGLNRSEFSPQRLDFTYLRFHRPQTGFLNALQGTFSINRQEDDRLEQARPLTRLEIENARITSYGYQGQGTTLLGGAHAVTFGAELYDEHVGSSRILREVTSPSEQRVRPEIPDGTRYTTRALFVQDAVDVWNGRVSLRGGLRYGTFHFRTRENAAFNVIAEDVDSRAVTFSAGAVVALTSTIHATASVNRGFRAANAFDLGAIGISGGGFEIAPSTAVDLNAEIGSSDGADATSTGQTARALRPEHAYSYEGGLKLRASAVSASLTIFDLELDEIIQRRTAIFPQSVVGTTVAGYTIVRQDAAGRAFIDADPRPIVTRTNIDSGRVRGVEGDVRVRIGSTWTAGAYFSLANGVEGPLDTVMRRMPPPLGGVTLRWTPHNRAWWVEGVGIFARPQTRLNAGDLGDARIGGRFTRATIANFFNGTAVDLGLVRDGVLRPTGETLAQVQTRLLGSESTGFLFTETPGFFVLGLRGGVRLTSTVDISVLTDNIADKNYRWHGSGVDAPGINAQLRIRYRF